MNVMDEDPSEMHKSARTWRSQIVNVDEARKFVAAGHFRHVLLWLEQSTSNCSIQLPLRTDASVSSDGNDIKAACGELISLVANCAHLSTEARHEVCL